MNYYIDTEFLEGTQTKRMFGILYGTTKPTIDPISLALVAEDGREYYAISKDFNLKEAWNRYDLKKVKEVTGGYQVTRRKKVYWIRENVLRPIFDDLLNNYQEEINERLRVFRRSNMIPSKIYRLLYLQPANKFTLKNLRKLIKKYGKSNAQIAEEVKGFVNSTRFDDKVFRSYTDPEFWDDNIIDYCSEHNIAIEVRSRKVITNPVFYGYYADYDWVVFCWLFGRMVDLPDGFPMYCRDLKQMLDEKALETQMDCENIYDRSKDRVGNNLERIKRLPDYPKQSKEHNALADARWNRELYKFIQTINGNA